jgi:hypothetical protein
LTTHRNARVRRGHLGCREHLFWERLEVERQAVLRQARIAGLPGRISQIVGPLALIRVQDLTNAAQIGMLRVLGQNFVELGVLQWRVGHNAMGKAMLIGDGLKPGSLGYGLPSVDLTLQMDRLHQRALGSIAQKVVHQIPAHNAAALTSQTWVAMQGDIPQVMVGVNHWRSDISRHRLKGIPPGAWCVCEWRGLVSCCSGNLHARVGIGI